MAEGKKGFIMYADQQEIFEQLSDVKAGKLIKHILKYINDENPELSDSILNLAFTPIKQQLKRDLKKYENICERNRLNGAKGGRPKNPDKPKKPSGKFGNPKKPKKPDTDNDTDNDNDTVTDIDNDIYKSITKKWFDFYEKRMTVKPSFDGTQGKSLKSIIKHLEKQKKDSVKTEDTFQYILDHWGLMENWMQSSCLDLKVFNSKINVVLDQIKNGKSTKGIASRLGQYFESVDPNYKNL